MGSTEPLVPLAPVASMPSLSTVDPGVPTDRIVVSGFEPFGTAFRSTNPSWVAAKSLDGRCFNFEDRSGGKRTVVCESRLLPVVYTSIAEMIPRMHENDLLGGLPPLLYLHMGASNQLPHHFLRLETRGHGTGYTRPDNEGKAPLDGTCYLVGPGGEALSIVDVVPLNNSLPARVMERHPRGVPWQLSLSSDAGRYLCDFTLHASTRAAAAAAAVRGSTPVPVLFLHVPPVGGNSPLTENALVDAVAWLVATLCEMLAAEAPSSPLEASPILLEGNVGLRPLEQSLS
ncbi:hypothetical protein DFJ74DRAFT_13230 [Hyaloraphidium curvatum]|nr:hypothetical protein DFJ74DRAFT_13230 [Hyaloraphidium curvatum]